MRSLKEDEGCGHCLLSIASPLFDSAKSGYLKLGGRSERYHLKTRMPHTLRKITYKCRIINATSMF